MHGEKLPFLFFSMILHVFLSRPFQGQNLKKIYGTQKWQKTMGNFRREFREHRKISVDRLCSFGIYYLISSAWASSIFEKKASFIYIFSIIISSTEVSILPYNVSLQHNFPRSLVPSIHESKSWSLGSISSGSDNFLFYFE